MTTTTRATTLKPTHLQPATGQPRRVGAKVPNNGAQHYDDSDPFDIKQELKNAPRPRPGYTSNIVEFYKGRSVFITGASGFIGKVLIEKLLRTCPDIKRVFVLIRPKFNKKPHERLKELLNVCLFDGLREHGEDQQKFIEQKVCLVEGDVTQANLGLSSYDLARIVQEVSVIFHSAATVKFDEPLKQSVSINITGTKNMINLCRRIPQLAGLVHISTAYANCDLETIDEHIYPVDMDPERLIEMADWLDQDTLQELKWRLLGAKPNTYTYTKSLAEWLLIRSGRDLPVVICRPSIVVASANEPFKGWIDNMNGPTGVVLGAGKGLVRSMFAETEYLADLVPVDKVINLIVTLGWFANLSRLNRRKLLNGQASGRGTTKTTTTALDESLSDSLLISSSVCSSSAAGSSAASTSGMDDSLQDEELHSEHTDHHQHARHHHHQQHEHHHINHSRHHDDDDDDDVEELCDHHARQIEHHREHSCSCNHLRLRHRQSHGSADSHEDEENINSSQEDDCADLSLTASESSSSISNSGGQSGGDRQNLCPLSEEEGLYSLQQEQSKQPTKSEEELHLSAIARDDGYASRSPEYANSIASESDSSSSAGGKTSSGSSSRRRTAGRSCGGKLTEASGGAGATKILSISEMEQQEMGAASRPLNELCENNESSQYIMANHDDDDEHHHNNHDDDSDHPQQGAHRAVTASTIITDEEIAAKLRKLRARTVAKLNDKNLPEELADIPVFHCTSGGENPITWGQVQLFVLTALWVFPISDTYRYPSASFTNKPKLDLFYSITLHYVPAYLIDLIIRFKGGKPILVKIFKKFDQAARVLKAFTSKQWKFDYDNRLFLMQELMNEEDRRLFDCNLRELDWRQFCCDYVIGVRKFLLKEPMTRLAESRRSMRFVYYRNLCLQLVAATIGAYCASSWMGLLNWGTS